MISKEKEEILQFYNLGLTAYKQRKWSESAKAFEQALKLDPDDGPSAVYLDRAKTYQEHPPPDDWDGVFEMKTK